MLENEVKKTILIVDDVEMNRKMLSAILSEKYNILEASNGRRAWDVLKKEGNRVSLILLDIVMPVMDGFSFMKFIQMNERLKRIPIIFVTSETYQANIQEGFRLGVRDVIAKPFEPGLVSSRVDHLIRLTESRMIRESVPAVPVEPVKKKPEPRTALIVDDISINREILKNALKDRFDILEAEDGREALRLIELKRDDIAVVLLDIVMPVMDGVEMMREVKSRQLLDRVPVIAITGDDKMPDLARGMALGICEVFRKPFNPLVIRNRVEYMIELFRSM